MSGNDHTDEPRDDSLDERAPGLSLSEGELDELLGAYALDAVDDDERRAVEQYLLVNPRARAEVEDHREVASLLAWSGAAAPDGLWDRITAGLEETAPAPRGELAAVLASERPGGASAPVPVGRAAGRARARWFVGAAWVATAAAAAAVAVLVVDNGDDAAPLEAALADARSAPTSKVVRLVSADGQPGGEVVIDAEGRGFLVADELPSLPENRTWQLWGVVDGAAISLGILGNDPELAMFTVEGSVTQVIVTNEAQGGVISDGNLEGSYGGFVG
jgi:anti-sigma factor RsiW